jgi:hypothetical protein
MSDQHPAKSRARRSIIAGLALIGALAAATAVSAQARAQPAPTSTTTTTTTTAAAFLGRWNYQTPQPATGLNIANVSGNGYAEDFPQVGWIDFTRGHGDEVTGRTDQGCTWHFAVERKNRLQLAYPGQSCFNNVIGSRYQMNRWTVTVRGDREQEHIQATSFLPSGDYSFTLADGARTKVTKTSGAAHGNGDWTFNPANQATGVNIETVVTDSGQESRQPVSGKLDITTTAPNKIRVRTPNGCQWKLNVAGNTAELAGAQTCRLPGGAAQTYTFWAMAVGRRHLYLVRSGSNASDDRQRTAFSLATGLLTRR